PVNQTLINYLESYTYDDYKKQIGKTVYRDSQIINKQLIADYDHFNNITEAYLYEEGKNWVKTESEYNYEGNFVYAESHVLDSSDQSYLLNQLQSITTYHLSQRKYVLYEKYYEYNNLGRMTAESINRYSNDIQKKKYYEYDSLGRVKKTINDDIIEEVIEWEDESPLKQKKLKISVNNGFEEKIFYNIIQYSDFRNIIYTIDRDGYKYYNKTDAYGNKIKSYKEYTAGMNNEIIYEQTISYDPTANLIIESNVISDITTNMINTAASYQ
ncbi:unnamed protein product, partial [marine sediment metagenome]